MNNEKIFKAVAEYNANQSQAIKKYGKIEDWNTKKLLI